MAQLHTAPELVEQLRRYGNLPVGVVLVDPEDRESPPIYALRLELSEDPDNGGRFLAITAYEER